jgi:hypothetical protein
LNGALPGSGQSGNDNTGGATTTGGSAPVTPQGGSSTVVVTGGMTGSGNSGGISGVCESVSAEAELEQVHLVFGFDVSGSMGQGDFPWHDRALKWEPVVAATKDFFEDPASAGLKASLTTFPKVGEEEKCMESSYEDPEVPMTDLPSGDFGELLDQIGSEPWRGGTPTLPMLEGVFTYIDEQRSENPGRYVLVVVTDGYPQGCEDQSIESVVNAVADESDIVSTYVIGVANPPIDGAPDTVSDLGAIAEAGRTDEAFIVDTGAPDDTATAFQEAIERIRGQALSCNLPIPTPPDGRVFDKQRVEVVYSNDSDEVSFTYDPDCASADAWHYDDPANPRSVVLCDDTCELVQIDPEARLRVNFACQNVIVVE